MEVRITLSARLPIKLIKRKNWVVASCPILDVQSQGETIEKAKKNLTEALTLFFISCFERSTLDAVLKSCGFTPQRGKYVPPKTKHLTSQKDYINVPIPFLIKQNSRTRCHA